MKPSFSHGLGLTSLCLVAAPLLHGQAVNFDIDQPAGESVLELSWKPAYPNWTGTPLSIQYQPYESEDLLSWTPVGEPLWTIESDGLSQLSIRLPRPASPQSHFRLESEFKFHFHDKNGLEVPSYNDQFEFFLQDLEGLSIDAFEQQFGENGHYLDQLSWDVTEAEFWEEFNTSPDDHNAGLPPNDLERRLTDFRLDDNELALFKRNGFVVTERLSAETFVDMFYNIWTDDLPVFFSTDAALQAWHRSFRAVLEEVEVCYLRPKLIELVDSLRAHFPSVWEEHGDGPMAEGLRDIDFYLTVAASLLVLDELERDGGGRPIGEAYQPPAPLQAHVADQQDKVEQWLDDIRKHTKQDIRSMPFGEPERFTDFTQFEVRGHYEYSSTLQSYFRATMWLGFLDFRVGGGFPATGSQRQLAGACSMALLLDASGQTSNWQLIEDTLAAFVGLSDSMTPVQLLGLLQREDMATFDAFTSFESLSRIQEAILTGPYGLQEIPQAVLLGCPVVQRSVPDRSFTFFGQRFVPDSWVTSQVVFDRIWIDETPVIRRIPSNLDVAFAALGNRQTVGLLAERMRDPNGMPFRDGQPYQHNLAAAYQTLQAQEDVFWKSNIYQTWLGALRELSPPTTDGLYPDAMRTRAWSDRTLNTQLASWTHLRHDTLLYVKQSNTPPVLCSYPAGYVEPRPDFWDAMAEAASLAGTRLSSLDMEGTIEMIRFIDEMPYPLAIERAERKQAMLEYFDTFESTMKRLSSLARAELRHEPFDDADILFMKSLVQNEGEYAGFRDYSGWYPALYYSNYFDSITPEDPSDHWDPVVADVHTDHIDACYGDPGGVLHQAVGNVNLMMLAVEHGERRCMFAGPVFSYYELFKPDFDRMTDSDWKAQIQAGDLPPRPVWTGSFLARGEE